jgi:hypothetical protein
MRPIAFVIDRETGKMGNGEWSEKIKFPVFDKKITSLGQDIHESCD